MSEAQTAPPAQTAAPAQTATVYFIDDSATMREVIKIAFKKENIQVVTCPSVAAAIEQFGKERPGVVISDVIMPDRDGYELCTYVKQHPELGATPVILMSGVVNRTVAEKATVVRADELLRKPFQPHELVARVKKLLRLDAPAEAAALAGNGGVSGARPANGQAGLGDLFAAPLPAASVAAPPAGSALVTPSQPQSPAAPPAPAAAQPPAARPAPPQQPRPAAAQPAAPPRAPQNPAAQPADVQRLRLEIQRLELLVKKLQSELEAERQYCQALEAHIRALQGVS